MQFITKLRQYRPNRFYRKPRFSLVDQSSFESFKPASLRDSQKDYLTINVEELSRKQRLPSNGPQLRLKRNPQKKTSLIQQLQRQDILKQSTRTRLECIMTVTVQNDPGLVSSLFKSKPCSVLRPFTARRKQASRPEKQRSRKNSKPVDKISSAKDQYRKNVFLLNGLDQVIRGYCSQEDHIERAHRSLHLARTSNEREEESSRELTSRLKKLSRDLFEQKVGMNIPTKGILEQINTHRSKRLSRAQEIFGVSLTRRQEESTSELSPFPSKSYFQELAVEQKRVQAKPENPQRGRNKKSRKQMLILAFKNVVKKVYPNTKPFQLPGSFAFFNAIQDSAQVFRLLLDKDIRYLLTVNEYGQTPLIVAVLRAQTDLVSTILRYNCLIDHRDKFGKNAVHYAAKHGFKQILQQILQSKANPWSGGEGEVFGDKDCRMLVKNSRIVHLSLAMASITERAGLWQRLRQRIKLVPFFCQL